MLYSACLILCCVLNSIIRFLGNLVDEDIQTPNEADSDVSLSSFLHVCHQTDTETEETQVEPGQTVIK